jgi:prevent-host-death family protein
MTLYNMHEAKTQLSRLVERAVEGEEIVIGRANRPLVRLDPIPALGRPRTPGALRGRITRR